MEGKKTFFTYLAGWKSRKGKLLLALLALVGILLLLFGGLQSKGGEREEDYAINTEAYRAVMEKDLTEVCRKIGGVGEVTVYITLECGEEYVFAADESASGGVDYVIKGGEGLLLYRKTPAVSGVAVVCDGGRDPAVKNALLELLHATLGIPYSRISICSTK